MKYKIKRSLKHNLCLRFIVAAFTLSPAIACAWGEEGHSVVALIAQQKLIEQAKSSPQAAQALKAVNAILGETKFDVAAVWPDKVKTLSRACSEKPYVKDPEYQSGGKKGVSSAICDAYKNTSNWHFINTDTNHYKMDATNPNYFKGDLAIVITGLAHLLKGEPAPTLEGVSSFTNWRKQCEAKAEHNCKLEALEFLMHFVGDIHQPLHLGANCDLGGNLQLITFFGEEKDPGAFWCKPSDPPTCSHHELHQGWDTNLWVHQPATNFKSNAQYVTYLSERMSEATKSSDAKACVKASPQDAVKIDEPNGPMAWADESLCYIQQIYSFPDDGTLAMNAPARKGKNASHAANETPNKETRKVTGKETRKAASIKAKASRTSASAMEDSGGNSNGSPEPVLVPNRCRADRAMAGGRGKLFSSIIVGEKYGASNLDTINERLYWGGQRLAQLLVEIYGNGDKGNF